MHTLTSQLAVLFIVTIAIADGRRWSKDMGWCNHAGSELHLGDFNGDSKMDMLCHDTNGYKWISFAQNDGTFVGTSWEYNLQWCHPSVAKLFIGDFNGDRRADMLCHRNSDGYKWIAFANTNGNFLAGTSWERGMGWCYHASAQLFIGDFNGDGRDDMLCHDTNSGYKWIAYANGNGVFTRTSWESAMGWCSHANAELHVGDFNGDSRDDILCHDTSTGYKWIAYATSSGGFTGTNWQRAMGWCNHAGSSLYVQDFNGDGRSDILCHDGAGSKWIAFASLENGNFNAGTSWQSALGWCYHRGAQFFVADFNGDKDSDMFCHDTNTGRKWIAFADTQISFN